MLADHAERSSSTGAPQTVLYIAGKGRSGSTLLDNLLGEVDGFFTVGELHHLWDWGLVQGFRCGCGEAVPSCAFWQSVEADLRRTHPSLDAAAITSIQREILKWPRMPWLMTVGEHEGLAKAMMGAERWARLQYYISVMGELYRSIATVAGCEVVVDASKWPITPVTLGLLRGVDLAILHLVRDPRAVAQSWRRPKPMRDRREGSVMPTWSAGSSALSWMARNLGAEWVTRRHQHTMTLRYEDLADDPEGSLRSIIQFATCPPRPTPLAADGRIEFSENHAVGGNPDRLDTGPVIIERDDRWKSEQSPLDRWITTAITSPLLGRYGYPLRVRWSAESLGP